MGTVYILQSIVNERYCIGSTNDFERRMFEHNSGRSTYTKLTGPFKLVFSQQYETLKTARKIEYKLKRLKSRIIIEKIIRDKRILMDS